MRALGTLCIPEVNMEVNKILEIQNKIVPETVELFMRRYEILKIISEHHPIGRRALSNKLGITERTMRTEIEKLKEINLIQIQSSGVYLTDEGNKMLSEIQKTFYYIKKLSETELKLKEKLKLRRVIVVPGDVNKDIYTFNELGKKAAEIIIDLIKTDTVLGITGGTTMSCVVNQMKKKNNIKNLLVLPARGALSEDLGIEANTIAANLAEKLNSDYKLLHIPDNLDYDELKALKNNKLINEVLEDIKKINLLVFGLGNAKDMALRRKADKYTFDKIVEDNLIAEAFGYYFDQDGKMKMQTNSVGITLENYKEIKDVVAVAAGSIKAEAIYAISKFNNNFILVTDEGAANKILSF
jgi:central glycolytic genes regulator